MSDGRRLRGCVRRMGAFVPALQHGLDPRRKSELAPLVEWPTAAAETVRVAMAAAAEPGGARFGIPHRPVTARPLGDDHGGGYEEQQGLVAPASSLFVHGSPPTSLC